MDTISDNLHIFETAEFRQRLKDNPFVNSLAQDARKPDAAQLQTDISDVVTTDPLVKKLVFWRNNFVAHLSPKLATGKLNLTTQHSISDIEIKILVDNAVRILNRYSNLFSATVQSTMLIGEDDFKTTIKAVRDDLIRHEKEMKAFLDSARRAQ